MNEAFLLMMCFSNMMGRTRAEFVLSFVNVWSWGSLQGVSLHRFRSARTHARHSELIQKQQ